jgi:regulation of enolase protein 1 (concanavalin A-like superfamily)
MFEHLEWLNEPEQWSLQANRLQVRTDEKTDFWRETHYGFIRDSGHFLFLETAGDFTAQVKIQGQFSHLYDQAGLMVRLDDRQWVKAGAEISDGMALLSSVLTSDQSDWATGSFPGDPSAFWIRATVSQGVLRLQVSVDGLHWPLGAHCLLSYCLVVSGWPLLLHTGTRRIGRRVFRVPCHSTQFQSSARFIVSIRRLAMTRAACFRKKPKLSKAPLDRARS